MDKCMCVHVHVHVHLHEYGHGRGHVHVHLQVHTRVHVHVNARKLLWTLNLCLQNAFATSRLLLDMLARLTKHGGVHINICFSLAWLAIRTQRFCLLDWGMAFVVIRLLATCLVSIGFLRPLLHSLFRSDSFGTKRKEHPRRGEA